jgi:hypothetical protein
MALAIAVGFSCRHNLLLLAMDDLPDKELLWRQYNMYVDLYKFYLELVFKGNVFFYLITGGILTFYFTHREDSLIKYSLLLPVVMSIALGLASIFGAKLLGGMKKELLNLKTQLGLDTYPSIRILQVLLKGFGVMFLIVATGMIILILIR